MPALARVRTHTTSAVMSDVSNMPIIGEGTTPLSPSAGSKTPVKHKTAKASSAVLSPNNDAKERIVAREHKTTKAIQRAPSNASQGLMAAAPPTLALSANQIVGLYSNCLKLASENKINAKNSWSLPLIDHIAELVKPDRTDADEDYNFQKASCTLDAGVKIYGCRVDSVHTEAYKVLAGVNRTGNGAQNDDENDDDDENDGENGGEPGAEGGKKNSRKKNSGPRDAASTIESNPEALNIKRDSSGRSMGADPLFQRMSSKFDAGGPRGLLLFNLAPHKGVELLFDSSDAMSLRCPAGQEDVRTPVPVVEVSEEVPLRLSAAAGALENMLGVAAVEGDTAAAVTPWRPGMALPAVMDDDDEDFGPVGGYDDDDVGGGGGADLWGGAADDDSDDDNDCFGGGGGDDGGDPFAGTGLGDSAVLAVAPTSGADWLTVANSRLVGQSWRGAAHWRYRAPTKSTTAGTADDDDESRRTSEVSELSSDSRRKSAPSGFINFSSVDLGSIAVYDTIKLADDDEEELQLAASAAAGDSVAGAAGAHLLPADLHIQPRDLASLALRPGHAVRGAGAAAAVGVSAYAAGDDAFGGSLDAMDGAWGGGDEDDDDDGGDDGFFGWGGDSGGDADTFGDVREVSAPMVAYDRRPNHVDVAAVKQKMWGALQGASDDETDFAPLVNQATAEGGGVHVAFICLLHLCNENNLALSGSNNLDALKVTGM